MIWSLKVFDFWIYELGQEIYTSKIQYIEEREEVIEKKSMNSENQNSKNNELMKCGIVDELTHYSTNLLQSRIWY